ncbi:MAG TPA: YoaK family protein [Solirubrobacteraceae bacterium]|nr:YoaK family protein [Solirubrobacteraceae bacterium]
MNAIAGSAGRLPFDEEALKRGAANVRHPLTRALLVLTLTTGLIDAVSYLGLGHVFTANMTGNIVLLGFGLAGGTGLPVVAPLVSLGAFLLGAGMGGALVKRVAGHHPRMVAAALAFEVIVLAVAALVAAVADVHPGQGSANVLIALMASAMGVRNAVVRRIAVPDLTTTVLTMTLTGLAAESKPAGGNGEGSVRRISAVLAMLLGALAGALLLKTSLALPLALAAALALATGVIYIPAGARRGRPRRAD